MRSFAVGVPPNVMTLRVPQMPRATDRKFAERHHVNSAPVAPQPLEVAVTASCMIDRHSRDPMVNQYIHFRDYPGESRSPTKWNNVYQHSPS
jgi:hypothetical protein